MLRVRVTSGENEGRVHESAADKIRIGRSPECDVVLSDWHVSAEHASIEFAGDRYIVTDHQSTNGTRVRRGDSVIDVASQPAREAVLEKGDVLLLGDLEHPVVLSIEIANDDADAARIVSIRKVNEISSVEAQTFTDRDLLHKLYEAQKNIARVLELDQVIGVVAAEVFKFVPRATHITVALREEDEAGRPGARYLPWPTQTRTGTPSSEIAPMPKSILKRVISDRAAVLAADARAEVGETASLMAAQIVSTMGVPLWLGEEILGVVQVDSRASRGLFGERDLDVLAILAQAASQSIAHARLYQRLRLSEERQRKENIYLKRQEKSRRFDGILGTSPPMLALFDQLRKVVDTRVTVLVEGETGTGKELVASAVHYWSNRKERLFVAQNCAAMPENLLESELFGHKKGSFTGATEDKKGLFELADGGTLFLDEIGEMPLNLQAKLLRVLQEGEVRPVGSNTTKRVDVRIVAATNRDLEKEVAAGRFREDLFYRIRVFPIRLPALRERRTDIPILAEHFIQKYSHEFGKKLSAFTPAAIAAMQSYRWPGNVRELENEVQRLVIQLEDGEPVRPEHLSSRVRQGDLNAAPGAESRGGSESTAGGEASSTWSGPRSFTRKGTLKETLDELERQILLEALAEHGNNKSATAKTLGITREGLHKKLRGFGIS